MSARDLEVYRRAEELLYRVYPRVINFPKSEIQSLSLKVKNSFIDMLTYMDLGNSVKSKRLEYLQHAEAYLKSIKVQLALAKKRRYINVGFHDEVQIELTEINKMLSGWIRSSVRRK